VISAVLAGVRGPAFILEAGGGLSRLALASMASLPGGVTSSGLFLLKVAS
jgi:hypothetical protein